MVFRVEESIAAVRAPPPGAQADLLVCQAVFESSRYLVYASDSLLVVLVEAPPVSTPDQSKGASRFELWQVWNAQDTIRCVRFNSSKKAARGALALCIDEGRGVLLMPASATSSRVAAMADASRASTLDDRTGSRPTSIAPGSDVIPRSDYVKAHLSLHLPRWAESVRWKCDDRLLNHLEWVESGDDLFLLGAGEKLSIWKLVDDSVQVYLQRTVTLSGGGGPGMDSPLPVEPVCHFDVAPCGRFAATAGKYDRIVKVWDLGELSPHEGAPMSMFLAHTRALVSMMWSKDVNVYSARSTVATAMGACEMLFTLDRAGSISIWRKNVAPLRSFVLWKHFAAADLCVSSFDKDDASLASRIQVFGLVNHYWARETPKAVSSINEALLSENTVMDALCLFHYGYGSLNEARRNELVSQRMDSITNAKLLGDRSGAMADTSVGEAFICGNVALEKTFVVNLLYGVLDNGDLCIFREEAVPFTGASPKLSLLLSYSGLREQLVDAHVYSVSSSDYQDQESGSAGFFVEVLFQQKKAESYLQCARLKLQVETTNVRTRRRSVSYSVQSCEVCAVCRSMMSAKKEGNVQSASLSVANMTSRCLSGSQGDAGELAVKIATTNMGGRLNVFLASGSLRRLEVAFRSSIDNAGGPVTHTALFEERGVLYLLIGGKLHVAMVTPGGETKVTKSSPSDPLELRTKPSLSIAANDALKFTACYMDESNDFEELDELISVEIPESVRTEWSNSLSFFSQPATSNPTKDYSMTVGIHKGRRTLTVWVFSFEITISGSLASSVQLFRKSTVDMPGTRLLGVASVPLLNSFEVTFASFDADSQLTLWTFADLDDLLEVTPAHRVDVGALMRMASQAQRSHMEFHLTEQQFVFKHFSFSLCGRVAILFGGGESEADDKICFLPTMEISLEAVIEVPRKQFGQVVSLEWTPPVSPERDCELLFLSTTTIGMLKFDCSVPTNKWSIAWSSSRFSVRPENISSLSSYPYGLLRVGSSLAHLNLRDIDGAGSSSLQLPFASPLRSRGQSLGPQPPSKAFPAYHPVTLMYLLARGSFETLERVLEHVKLKIVEHEETCYLRMTDDTVLRTLPLLSLSKLLGDPTSTESKSDERSDVYLKGKENKRSGRTTYAAVSSAPARASDLFAMDFGAPRRYGASAGGADRADMLFAPQTSTLADSPASPATAPSKSKLETDEFSKFFNEHKSSLTFMATRESKSFLAIVAGIKKTFSWERDSSRQKDEAALRFHASLLWPVDQPASDTVPQPTATDSDVPDQQPLNRATAPTQSHRVVGGLCSEQVAWGALSDFQPELLQECFPTGTMSWKEMRHLRLPFWLKSSAKLVQFTEKVAQAEYAANRDPFAVAVFYVLLGKTSLLASLFKMGNESRISELLKNNFSDLRWKNAAIKNAYVLKTKQRYELSAAFFLLGGKVIEAVSVAEQADKTLVLSFLIARISEKWDLGGQDYSLRNSGVADFSQASFTGLSTSLRGLADQFGTNSGVTGGGESSEAKNLCADFLNTTVWAKASKCGDVYMCFLVKYFLGETSNAIDILMTPPTIEMRSMFGDTENAIVDPSSMYWSAFGKSLLGACDLLRFLRKTIVPIKLALKEKILRLNTSAMLRLQDAGLGIPALIHQRDLASFVQDFRRERATSYAAAAFLACRQRVLVAAIGNQVDFLYAMFLKSMREAMATPASSASSTRFDLEERLNEEIQCIVRHGGDYALPSVPETSKENLEHRVRTAVVESLVHSGRLAALDFLVSGWSHSEGSSPKVVFTSPLPLFVEAIAEGVAWVASGDLMSAATDCFHTRKVDQTCSNLLAMAMRLLLWLQYFYLKPAKQRATLPSREFVRVAVAAVHSVVCICCRYLKNPCCLYRVLGLIFPHKDGLSSNSEEALNEIAGGDLCVTCTSLRRPTTTSRSVRGVSSLEQDIPVLYQAVCMLELELDEFTAAVKTNRLHHPMPSRDFETPLFSYCSYWGLVLVMAADAMPAHLSRITGQDIPSTAVLFKKLVEAWGNYSNGLARFALKHLLCDLAGFFFSPFSISHAPSSPSLPSSPRGSASPSRSGAAGSPRAFLADAPGSPPSPQRVNRRQLLKCECERCPWLLLVEFFTDKNELLLRLNAQLECCSEKIDEEVRWGRLPEPASRKSALTRSQKLLLSSVAENAPTFSRATNLTDQLKRRMASMPTAASVHVQCVYRSETNIKAMCFNRAAGEDAEVSVCSSKGIFRASCMDYAEGSRFQFKGMYAPPQTSFFSSDASVSSPVKRRQAPDALNSGNFSPSSSLATRNINPPSPLRNPAHLLTSPSEPKMASFKPTAVASHPFLPLFVSGNHKGRVHLWSYDRLSAVCAFQTKDIVTPYPSSPSMLSGWRSIKALEFDNLGQQLGAVDPMGHLFMWKFSELDRAPYYREIVCHDKGAKGLVFLNSSSTLATVGTSSEKRNVCVWDTLLPTSKALVAAPACHPAGATSVAFSSTHQLLITGGAGGALSIFDMRQRRVLHTISNAHETPIKTIVLHPSGDCVLSGSAGGDVKIWSLPIFREVAFLAKVHVKPSFLGDAATNFLSDAASNVAINVTNSSWGVTDAVATKDAFYTSGTDGSIQRLKVPSLGTRL
ncbi:hypothetical protein PC129_g4175 [Phytophthora cactorum]|uniref:RAVE complex protein Rav1 C-terminal domain-containing protein n=1 Tax=Phytophthora cactorum TaxID=29920 RepID=A0A8T0ZB00_9STRA|nr:hypothetical protein Pcac1_g20640 [Phytophthora cactorum]KAG2835769.1 hypothetical protein PC111_g5315 [Phytophthora cactorum]KAG2837443.1 hypothetical protein PC112_g4923 [Phytophthora cactorum]KAG2859372.1 hypothetical protein PC113_g8990 [Phytophthora cactorum]KAG2918704.1 hypothetical protein PC114_g6742 [Phytophthora cactorum]